MLPAAFFRVFFFFFVRRERERERTGSDERFLDVCFCDDETTSKKPA